MITSSRTFGIELEMGARDYRDIDELRKKIGKGWRFDDDGSIRDQLDNPIEVVSPILRGSTGEAEVRKTCALLKDLHFDADHVSCGFHVHLGAEEFKEKEGLLVLTREEMRRFLESNEKDIRDICFASERAVQLVNNFATTTKLLTKRYRQVGENILSGFWMKGRVTSRKSEAVYLQDEKRTFRGKKYTVHVLDTGQVVNGGKDIKNELSAVTGLEENVLSEGDEGYFEWLANYERAVRRLSEAKKKKDSVQLDNSVRGRYIIRVSDNSHTARLLTLFLFYLLYDRVFMGMLPMSRREGNMYCAPLSKVFTAQEILACGNQEDFESLWYKERERSSIKRHKGDHYDDSRYHNVNFHSLFNRHGTVEIRSHGSTVNANKILLWASLHQTVLDRIADGTIAIDTLKKLVETKQDLPELALDMIASLALPDHLARYVKRMLNYFSNTNL